MFIDRYKMSEIDFNIVSQNLRRIRLTFAA
jgi:hypothetical protein